ncbi:hypothetical protein WMW71_07100 [Flavobacterium buctense]|uniref:Lipoprotein n=1 Tax=Flavobacterium buctense TaxID=1648146 RepID=A0ABU9E0C4_9FLAO|nr:hypothetical protein [Flavobacterium buctense]
MKRILGLLAIILLISACDDGELTVDTIDFEDVPVQKCPQKEILYKISDSKMLILAIPLDNFEEDETPENNPTEVNISGDIQVIYRQYSAAPTSANICDLVTSATPNLTEEWIATSGTIQITSTAIKSVNTTTGITQITGYRHYIVFQDITFLRPDGSTQAYLGEDTFVFGNYNATVSPLAFGFDEEANKSTCDNDNRIFNFNSSEAFILDLADYANLFQSAETTTPRTAYISATNKVNYRLYSGTVNNTYFCTTPVPATPTLTDQNWFANDGVEADGTGIIEVTTTNSSPGFFLHTIRLKKVTMTKGNSDFYLGDDYLYGSIITP